MNLHISDLFKYFITIFFKRWDDNLAYVAQKHADQCSFYHDDMTLRVIPNTGKYPGQNIAISGGLTSMNWSTAFDTMFAGEMKRWQYGLGIKKEFGNKHALHYIQVLLNHQDFILTLKYPKLDYIRSFDSCGMWIRRLSVLSYTSADFCLLIRLFVSYFHLII